MFPGLTRVADAEQSATSSSVPPLSPMTTVVGGQRAYLPVPTNWCPFDDQSKNFNYQKQITTGLLVIAKPCADMDAMNTTGVLSQRIFFWTALLDEHGHPISKSQGGLTAMKIGVEEFVDNVQSARAAGRRYPAEGPEVIDATVLAEDESMVATGETVRFRYATTGAALDVRLVQAHTYLGDRALTVGIKIMVSDHVADADLVMALRRMIQSAKIY